LLSLGVDIGGTKILAGAVDPSGEVVAERRVASPAQNPDQIINTVCNLIGEMNLCSKELATKLADP
jgi:predicted NBD/HSP70 family sugar kinase